MSLRSNSLDNTKSDSQQQATPLVRRHTTDILPSTWRKYGEIYSNRQMQSIYVCVVCRDYIEHYGHGYYTKNPNEFTEHIRNEHTLSHMEYTTQEVVTELPTAGSNTNSNSKGSDDSNNEEENSNNASGNSLPTTLPWRIPCIWQMLDAEDANAEPTVTAVPLPQDRQIDGCLRDLRRRSVDILNVDSSAASAAVEQTTQPSAKNCDDSTGVSFESFMIATPSTPDDKKEVNDHIKEILRRIDLDSADDLANSGGNVTNDLDSFLHECSETCNAIRELKQVLEANSGNEKADKKPNNCKQTITKTEGNENKIKTKKQRNKNKLRHIRKATTSISKIIKQSKKNTANKKTIKTELSAKTPKNSIPNSNSINYNNNAINYAVSNDDSSDDSTSGVHPLELLDLKVNRKNSNGKTTTASCCSYLNSDSITDDDYTNLIDLNAETSESKSTDDDTKNFKNWLTNLNTQLQRQQQQQQQQQEQQPQQQQQQQQQPDNQHQLNPIKSNNLCNDNDKDQNSNITTAVVTATRSINKPSTNDISSNYLDVVDANRVDTMHCNSTAGVGYQTANQLQIVNNYQAVQQNLNANNNTINNNPISSGLNNNNSSINNDIGGTSYQHWNSNAIYSDVLIEIENNVNGLAGFHVDAGRITGSISSARVCTITNTANASTATLPSANRPSQYNTNGNPFKRRALNYPLLPSSNHFSVDDNDIPNITNQLSNYTNSNSISNCNINASTNSNTNTNPMPARSGGVFNNNTIHWDRYDRLVTNIQNVSCLPCGLQFNQRSELMEHIKVHNNPSALADDENAQTATAVNGLNTAAASTNFNFNLNMMSNNCQPNMNRPYEMWQPNGNTNHGNTAEALFNRYICGCCTQEFRDNQSLYRHEQSHLSNYTNWPTQTERPFHYNITGNIRTASQNAMYVNQRHCHGVSDDPTIVKCGVCQRLVLHRNWRQHQQLHSCLRIKCNICGRTYQQRQSLRAHIRRNHPNAGVLSENTTNAEHNYVPSNVWSIGNNFNNINNSNSYPSASLASAAEAAALAPFSSMVHVQSTQNLNTNPIPTPNVTNMDFNYNGSMSCESSSYTFSLYMATERLNNMPNNVFESCGNDGEDGDDRNHHQFIIP